MTPAIEWLGHRPHRLWIFIAAAMTAPFIVEGFL